MGSLKALIGVFVLMAPCIFRPQGNQSRHEEDQKHSRKYYRVSNFTSPGVLEIDICAQVLVNLNGLRNRRWRSDLRICGPSPGTRTPAITLAQNIGHLSIVFGRLFTRLSDVLLIQLFDVTI